MYEHELVEQYLNPNPYFEAALAYDQAYASGGEHPVLRRLREGADPVFRSGGSPAGTNDQTFREGQHPRAAGGQFKPKYGPGGSHEHRLHELSNPQLEHEIGTAEERSSRHNTAMIEAGRGTEKFSESAEKAKQGEPLARLRLAHAAEEAALRRHRDYRQSHGEKFVRAEGRRRYQQLTGKGDDAMAYNDMLERNNNGGGARLRDLDVRGADTYYVQEPDQPEKMDPQTLIGLVELCLRGIDDPGERSEFLQELANLLTGSGYANGNGNGTDYDQMSTMPSASPPPQQPSYNSSFNGRGTVDRRPRRSRGDARGGADRALAMDGTVRALNAASFQRRFAWTQHIRLTGNCS
jgi:hypothetical protein